MSSPTTTIAAGAPLVTLVNVFTVDPSRQAELVQALDRATTGLMAGLPGFVSANLHASLDGTRVVNYAQWASEQHFQDMQQRPDVREHMQAVMRIAEQADPRLFTVEAVHHAASGSPD